MSTLIAHNKYAFTFISLLIKLATSPSLNNFLYAFQNSLTLSSTHKPCKFIWNQQHGLPLPSDISREAA